MGKSSERSTFPDGALKNLITQVSSRASAASRGTSQGCVRRFPKREVHPACEVSPLARYACPERASASRTGSQDRVDDPQLDSVLPGLKVLQRKRHAETVASLQVFQLDGLDLLKRKRFRLTLGTGACSVPGRARTSRRRTRPERMR
jgi:hypothetical protein